MKIRIIIALFFIFFFFIIGSTLAILSIKDVSKELHHVIKLHQVEELRRELVISIQNVQVNLYTVHTPLSQDLNLIVENVINLNKTSGKCSDCHHHPDINNRIIKVKSLLKDYENLLSSYITARANAERVADLKFQAASKGNEILSEVANMSHSATKKLEVLTNKSTDTINNVSYTLFMTIGISLLIGIMIAFKLTRSVTKPVRMLLEATKGIASGKLDTTVSYRDPTEFGELAEHFNIMSGELKKRTDALMIKESELEKKSIELQRRVTELEEFYQMAVGRELKMKELKDINNKLESENKQLESELSKYKK